MGSTKWNEMNWREETHDDDNDIINTPADGTAHSTGTAQPSGSQSQHGV